MVGYAFRIYFLPPPETTPNYWTKELIDYLPHPAPAGQLDRTAIDPSSACWRMVFVVTAYEPNSPQLPSYTYNGALG